MSEEQDYYYRMGYDRGYKEGNAEGMKIVEHYEKHRLSPNPIVLNRPYSDYTIITGPKSE